ncbi:antistasin-like isoform X2 [Photinus pyralis]|uniref:antistasin-like isoform X2 n=1 Tax=Photinus pyralis TaxID=7054 RepID=UPI0012674613|nr:antistasin-like isoform X2 [Photinus pyralis]
MNAVTGLIWLIASFAIGSEAHEVSTEAGVCKREVCEVYCPYGNVIDSNGCRTCECIANPCTNHTCPSGQECKIVPVLCKKAPCPFTATCGPECPLYKCVAKDCPYGYEVDENGCKGCDCKDYTKGCPCTEDQICIVEKLCPFGECGIKPKCVKKCPLSLPCHSLMDCPYGFELDRDNCQTCACKNPCAGVICPRAKYCAVIVLNCLVAPCPAPYPECQSYCPENSQLLSNLRNEPVTCTADLEPCPKGYDCHYVARLRSSFCCKSSDVNQEQDN